MGVSADGRLVLYGTPWETYGRLLRIFQERRGLRLTYDRGALELRLLTLEHERLKKLVARFVETLTEELDLPLAAYGSLTLRRPKRSGLEADESYWIENEQRVRNLQKCFHPRRDPPPDLAIEIEVARSALDRMRVYKALRVPEVWRHDGKRLRFDVLGPSAYTVSATSRTFPFLQSTNLDPFVALLGKVDMTTLGLQFRAWVRARIAVGWK